MPPQVLELAGLEGTSLVKDSLNGKVVQCQVANVFLGYLPGLFSRGCYLVCGVFLFFLAKIRVLYCDLFVLSSIKTEWKSVIPT